MCDNYFNLTILAIISHSMSHPAIKASSLILLNCMDLSTSNAVCLFSGVVGLE